MQQGHACIKYYLFRSKIYTQLKPKYKVEKQMLLEKEVERLSLHEQFLKNESNCRPFTKYWVSASTVSSCYVWKNTKWFWGWLYWISYVIWKVNPMQNVVLYSSLRPFVWTVCVTNKTWSVTRSRPPDVVDFKGLHIYLANGDFKNFNKCQELAKITHKHWKW